MCELTARKLTAKLGIQKPADHASWHPDAPKHLLGGRFSARDIVAIVTRDAAAMLKRDKGKRLGTPS
jgi:hypothetical protein